VGRRHLASWLYSKIKRINQKMKKKERTGGSQLLSGSACDRVVAVASRHCSCEEKGRPGQVLASLLRVDPNASCVVEFIISHAQYCWPYPSYYILKLGTRPQT